MKKICATSIAILLLGSAAVFSAKTDSGDPSLTVDFKERDRLPQSDFAHGEWKIEKEWGPIAAAYPKIKVPPGRDCVEWKRSRVIAVAKKYIGLPYRHHHIPGWSAYKGGRGLDCSNFASWVYNYGLGIYFDSGVRAQASGALAPGRMLRPEEKLRKGDLLFIKVNSQSDLICHVAIFIDEEHLIDSTAGGVRVRNFSGWYRDCFSHARRIIE